METILRLSAQRLSEADLLQIIGELHAPMQSHQTFISGKHRDGETFTAQVMDALGVYRALADATIKETGEARAAVNARSALYEQASEYIRQAKARAKMIASMIEDEEGGDALGAVLLRDYGVRGNQLNLNRNSHVERMLAKLRVAHQTHGALLEQWGSAPEFIGRAAALETALAEAHTSLSKERSEAELVLAKRDVAAAQAVALINRVFALVEAFQDEAPEALAAFQSVVNKHRAKLTAPAPQNNSGDPTPPDAA